MPYNLMWNRLSYKAWDYVAFRREMDVGGLQQPSVDALAALPADLGKIQQQSRAMSTPSSAVLSVQTADLPVPQRICKTLNPVICSRQICTRVPGLLLKGGHAYISKDLSHQTLMRGWALPTDGVLHGFHEPAAWLPGATSPPVVERIDGPVVLYLSAKTFLTPHRQTYPIVLTSSSQRLLGTVQPYQADWKECPPMFWTQFL